jgi:hypothetical protein
MLGLIESGYVLTPRGWLPPDWQPGDLYMSTDAAYRHLLASRALAEKRLISAALGGGYVEPLTCPDFAPEQ